MVAAPLPDVIDPTGLDPNFFLKMINELEDPIFLKDEHHRWIFVNEAFEKLVGQPDLLGKSDKDMFPKEQYQEFFAGDRFVLSQQKSLTQEEHIGADVWALVKKTPITLPNGAPGILGIIIDITEYRSIRLEVESLRIAKRQALHDPLTDLPNRRNLEEHFEDLKWRAAEEGHNIYMLHIDLDGFKAVNDDNGHAVGDAVLVHVAKVITALKTEDMFPARIGGDEFVVVLSPSRGVAPSRDWAERLIRAIGEPIPVGDGFFTVGASVGIASARDVVMELDALLHAADMALYRAKENGRNRVEIFTAEMHRAIEERKMQEIMVETGLREQEFAPHYQPQYDLATGRMIGVEALARWYHPDGVRGPESFLSIFEDQNRIDQLDVMMIEKVISDMRRLERDGMAPERVGINLSSGLLQRSDLVELFRRHAPLPCTIALELSEEIAIEDLPQESVDRINVLRRLGCEIDIDDFGSSRASIHSILYLRPDRLKIDNKFIAALPDDRESQQIVSGILSIARSLKIATVAEGVATERHAEIVRQMGFNHGQGFHFSKPVGLDTLRALLPENTEKSA